MSRKRLEILCVSPMPSSPPTCGAQARLHGLLTRLARRNDLTAVMLVDDEFDRDESLRAMRAFCRDVVLVPNPFGRNDRAKRIRQLQSLASPQSFESLRLTVPAFRQALDRMLQTRRFDLVNVEFPYFGHYNLRQAPAGARPPRVFVDSHEIAYDLARQFAGRGGLLRRVYAERNWRKLQRDELSAYRDADGVYLCSEADERRLLADIGSQRTAVVPNAADVDYYQPRASDPAPDGRTIVYFGLLSTVPNVDAVEHFVREIWPGIAGAHPDARFKIIGGKPPPALQALASDRVELTGFVPDLRPHLAEAAAVVVPLRLGGGTRLKIVEAMAMGKAVVSTTLGAEGIEATTGRDILIEDRPEAFAGAVNRLLADPAAAISIGQAARRLAVNRYSWGSAAERLEDFFRKVIEVTA